MEPAHRVVKNTSILYARMGITVFISLYTTRLILAALGTSDFGILNVVGGSIAMLMFLNNAMTGATQRFMSYAQGAGEMNRQKQIFNVSVVLHLVIAFIIIILLESVGYFLFNGILNFSSNRIITAKLIYHFMVVSTFFTIISVPYDAVINAHENMFFFAILGIIESVLKLVIALYIFQTSFDKLAIYGLLMVVLSISLLIVRQLYCHHHYTECRIQLKKHFNKVLLKEMTSFASWSFLGATTSMIGINGQSVVLNIFFGTVVNAAEGVAAQISGQLGAFATTMLKALNPIIAKSEGAGNRLMMLKASMVGSKLSFFLLIIFYIPVLIEMPFVFKLWLKIVPDYTVIFCRLLLIRNLVEQLYTTLTNSIAAVGKIKKFQIYSSMFYVVPLFVSYFLFMIQMPPYTIYAVFLFFSFVSCGITVYFSHKICDLSIPIYLKNIVLRCVASFIIIFFISSIPSFFLDQGFKRLLITTAISSVSYFIVVWLIGLTNQEKAKSIDILKVLINRLQLLFSHQNQLVTKRFNNFRL